MYKNLKIYKITYNLVTPNSDLYLEVKKFLKSCITYLDNNLINW